MDAEWALRHQVTRSGFGPGLNLDATVEAAALAAELVGHDVPSRLLRAARARRTAAETEEQA